jgi:purine-nucleoside phosphorylase
VGTRPLDYIKPSPDLTQHDLFTNLVPYVNCLGCPQPEKSCDMFHWPIFSELSVPKAMKMNPGFGAVKRGRLMERFKKQVGEAAEFVQSAIGVQPQVAFILGTGLGGAAEDVKDAILLSYDDIPHCPVSTVQSHMGNLICGTWAGKTVMVMQGRFHLYEGYTAQQVSFPIRLLAELGVEALVVCSAAGGLNPIFRGGDLMLVTDHINLTGRSPLAGPNTDRWGPRFPDMAEPYYRGFQNLAIQCALEGRIPLQRGVYVGVLGPNLETAAETRFLRAIGADAVGMSMVMEVITAVHAGIKTMGISVITNVNLPDNYQAASVEDIIATAESAVPNLRQLLGLTLKAMGDGR